MQTSKSAPPRKFDYGYPLSLPRGPPGPPPKPHVVLSTRFENPWLEISKWTKEMLEEGGCSVYNPNTDNLTMWQTLSNDVWLRTFNEQLEKSKQTHGFLVQIQQWESALEMHGRSAMQQAEQRQTLWLKLPKVALSVNGKLPEKILKKHIRVQIEDILAEARRQYDTPEQLDHNQIYCVTRYAGNSGGWC